MDPVALCSLSCWCEAGERFQVLLQNNKHTMPSQEEIEAKIEEATTKVSTQGAVVRELKDRVKALKKAKVRQSRETKARSAVYAA